MTDQDRSIGRPDVIMTAGLWHVTRSFLTLPDAAAT
jgi:hypothetical protein